VFNMNKKGALKSVIMGSDEGTTIDHAENLK
ncbi:MAG: UMP kinase, partial [Colwellia sp.]|nr:UMP kinase [Colwellia sp.]